MDRQLHDQYVEKVQALEEKLKALKIDTFELTEEEQAAIESAPESVIALHRENISRYVPVNESTDFREAAFQKFLAILLIEAVPIFDQAYKYGEEAGGYT